jgi:hypothetical protein
MGVLCYFCQEVIKAEGLDPCGITFSVRYPDESDPHGWQKLFCHFECFAKHDNPEFPLLRDYD